MIRLTPDQQKKGALIGGFVLVAAALLEVGAVLRQTQALRREPILSL